MFGTTTLAEIKAVLRKAGIDPDELSRRMMIEERLRESKASKMSKAELEQALGDSIAELEAIVARGKRTEGAAET